MDTFRRSVIGQLAKFPDFVRISFPALTLFAPHLITSLLSRITHFPASLMFLRFFFFACFRRIFHGIAREKVKRSYFVLLYWVF
jgi:hypothetical protein